MYQGEEMDGPASPPRSEASQASEAHSDEGSVADEEEPEGEDIAVSEEVCLKYQLVINLN